VRSTLPKSVAALARRATLGAMVSHASVPACNTSVVDCIPDPRAELAAVELKLLGKVLYTSLCEQYGPLLARTDP